ncbi:MAG TPA: cysteine desulfurase [Thermoanaerobaculia bacterium]|nr:cysteine desulfurase [Thermoanaerobaculia bacterium]
MAVGTGIEDDLRAARARPPRARPPAAEAPAPFDVERVRGELPVFAPGGPGGPDAAAPPLVYLDSAASAQKPRAVIDAVARFYATGYSNVHRGLHPIAAAADAAYEGAREAVRRYLNAPQAGEVVFVRGATEAINLVAWSYLAPRLEPGDEVLVTELEHHANIVPWQLVCHAAGARLVAAPIDAAGDLDLAAFAERLGPRTRMVAVTQVSNALGTAVPVAEVVRLAHERGVPVLVDGAQAVPHGPVDVQALGCDFYALSGHKMYGPTGIGALWARGELLAAMPPYQGGGGMIRSVALAGTRFAPPPERFEAGTPHIVGAVGLAAAIEWLEALDWAAVAAHEERLVTSAVAALEAVPGVTVLGRPRRRVGVVSFVVDGVHPHDVGTVLAAEGVAVRAGHHCAQPLMERLGVPATTRASFALYNRQADVEALARGVARVRELFA